MDGILAICTLFLNSCLPAVAPCTIKCPEGTQQQQQQQLPEASHQYHCVEQSVQLMSELACTYKVMKGFCASASSIDYVALPLSLLLLFLLL
jgi:hypothetical protein